MSDPTALPNLTVIDVGTPNAKAMRELLAGIPAKQLAALSDAVAANCNTHIILNPFELPLETEAK